MGGLSLSLTMSEYFFAGSEQRDATPLYGLKVGYEKIGGSITDSLGVEATINYFTGKSKLKKSDYTGYLLRLDALYPFIIGEKWMPFLAVGGGGIVINSSSSSSKIDKNYVFNYGIGLKYFIEDYLAVRADMRHLVVYDDIITRGNFEIGVGVSYYFGKERKKKPVSAPPKLEVKKPVVIIDESLDKPTPPPPAAPHSPVPPAILAPLLALESSAKSEVTGEKSVVKGVSPLSPVSAEVVGGKHETASQMVVAKTGEPVRQPVAKKIVRKLTIEFDTDRINIKPKYNSELKNIADIIKDFDDASALIEGHADSTGKLVYNNRLSKKRAESVRSYLVKFGVKPGKISSIVYGPSKPIASNATAKGKQKNRRAVTIVTLIEVAEKQEVDQELLPQTLSETATITAEDVAATRAKEKPLSTIKPEVAIVPTGGATTIVDKEKPSPLNKPEVIPVTIQGKATIKAEEKLLSPIKPEVAAIQVEGATKINAELQPVLVVDPEAEQRLQERLRNEKIDKESINAEITLPSDGVVIPAGDNGILPIVITNKGKSVEKFLLTMSAAKASNAILIRDNGSDENITRLQLAAGEVFKGKIFLKMPVRKADGDRLPLRINLKSTRFNDISFQKEAVVISSAPLMRVVAKYSKQEVPPGEKLRLSVTVLNAGSLSARNLSVRLKLPTQVNFLGAPGFSFKRQPNGMLFFNIDQMESGKVVKMDLDIEVQKDCVVGQELHAVVEVVNDMLQRKDTFPVDISVVQAK